MTPPNLNESVRLDRLGGAIFILMPCGASLSDAFPQERK